MNKTRLKQIIKKFDQIKVLVIGDLILDEFIWGKVDRISPEAPVPVVMVESQSFMPGGAANVAANVRSLDGKVYAIGVIGADLRGSILLDELKNQGINIEGILIDDKRPTTLKSRVVAHSQQVVRIDNENTRNIPEQLTNQILLFVKNNIKKIDAIIIEDYGKGVISPRLIKKLLKLARNHKKIVAVDPKEEHINYYQGATVITPNRAEALKATGLSSRKNVKISDVGNKLIKKLKLENVLITMGEDGMQLFEKSGKNTHIPTIAQEVFDVSGAGDTVIAAYALALASGAKPIEAAYLANYAAGIEVGKVGVTQIQRKELLKRIG